MVDTIPKVSSPPVRESAVAAPRISVVVPTFNRRDSLRQLLESLARQTLPTADYEVVVVSDGSTDGTGDLVRRLQVAQPNVTLLETRNRGPGAARNAGARAARAPYIAFTDDDCLATPGWLENLLQAFTTTGACVLQGRTTTNPQQITPFTHQVDMEGLDSAVPTCNAAYARTVFEQAGGFDESFSFAHNEDADLAWRVMPQGAIVYAPAAQIEHPPRRDTFVRRARWVKCLESEFYLFYKHPGLYRKFRGHSPWSVIYWNVFVIDQLRQLRACGRYVARRFNPYYFVVGVALVCTRWFNLLRFFPAYRRAQIFYREHIRSRPCSEGRQHFETSPRK
ncbi:MAG TPA: glycosyltransferase [Verrucomicrobiae bacterium]|nr:glycosyltransferase [Verrucomicrobiae bacterium]